jgi:dipeptidyl aminopeptidase/acylaminoacyl peptidase
MKTQQVHFYSDGSLISGLWRTPDEPPPGPMRAIVQGPGWLGLKDGKLYVRYHEALTAAGFGVLIFDYRGFGDSEGDRDIVSPVNQLRDLINAVTYLTTRDDVDADAIGTFGTGGTGGGNAVLLLAADDRVRAAVSQVPVADGADWLHRMRPEHEWLSYLEALDVDRRDRVLSGKGRMIHPREEIMVPTPVKADVDELIPTAVTLQSADEILQYRPIDAAETLTKPLMTIAVEGDATTPTDHALSLHEAAKGPKCLIMQRHTTHYAAYDRYWTVVTPKLVAWFEEHVRPVDVATQSVANDGSISTHLEVSP